MPYYLELAYNNAIPMTDSRNIDIANEAYEALSRLVSNRDISIIIDGPSAIQGIDHCCGFLIETSSEGERRDIQNAYITFKNGRKDLQLPETIKRLDG
ncbi:hypothetical protein ACFLZX_01735 [Nanoarchaeota archaeon]